MIGSDADDAILFERILGSRGMGNLVTVPTSKELGGLTMESSPGVTGVTEFTGVTGVDTGVGVGVGIGTRLGVPLLIGVIAAEQPELLRFPLHLSGAPLLVDGDSSCNTYWCS